MFVYCYFTGFSRQESSFWALAELYFPAKFCFANWRKRQTSARRGCCLGNRQGAREDGVGSSGGRLSAPWSHRRRPEAPQEKEKGRGESEKRWLTATLWWGWKKCGGGGIERRKTKKEDWKPAQVEPTPFPRVGGSAQCRRRLRWFVSWLLNTVNLFSGGT